MAVALTLQQIEEAFLPVIQTETQLAATSVRRAYQGDQQPAVRINQNVAFVYFKPSNNSVFDNIVETDHTLRDPVSGELSQGMDQTKFYTRVFEGNFMFYGPDSYDLADLLRFRLTQSRAHETLATSEIYPVLGAGPPVRIPYEFNGQWWQRADFTQLFNIATTRTDIVNSFASARIDIVSEQGTIGVIDLPV